MKWTKFYNFGYKQNIIFNFDYYKKGKYFMIDINVSSIYLLEELLMLYDFWYGC